MNPVNATALYVSACRSVLQCDPRDPETFAELFKVLPFFRESISCLVCGNLLQDPIAPKNSACQHYVCKGCKGKKMLLKPSCSWCKDYGQFEDNRQLCILVECYRKLCEYISEFPAAGQSASAVRGCPEVTLMLHEVLGVKEEQEEASVSETPPTPPAAESHRVPQLESAPEPLQPASDNGLNSRVVFSADAPAACVNFSEVAAAGAILPKLEEEAAGPESVHVCAPLPVSGEFCNDTVVVSGFSQDIKQEADGDTILLSVEEVLQSLESDFIGSDRSDALQRGLEVSGGRTFSVSKVSGALAPPLPQPPAPGVSCAAAASGRRLGRLNRKRSRSESDSETLQPLPIASFIQGSHAAAPAPLSVTCEPKASSQPTAKVPNGGVLKVNKTLLDSTKNIQKNFDHGVKKVYTKAKLVVPKTKDKTKDRLLAGGLIPGHPTKVVYKKAQEKKGCKCGRATQNPSVLTCRGQRCPCYSNRKACLDCICRGCQNSYMANGEKKLEAFAVPEKALEQTRLTLGINVTSIAVRNSGASAGVLSLAAGSPMASFLAAGPHDDHSFEDALEVQFDC